MIVDGKSRAPEWAASATRPSLAASARAQCASSKAGAATKDDRAFDGVGGLGGDADRLEMASRSFAPAARARPARVAVVASGTTISCSGRSRPRRTHCARSFRLKTSPHTS